MGKILHFFSKAIILTQYLSCLGRRGRWQAAKAERRRKFQAWMVQVS